MNDSRTALQYSRAFIVTLVASFAAASALAAPAAPAAKPVAKPAVECRAGETSFFRDEGMTMKVATKLQWNKELLREKIDVKVSGGVATLSGGVSIQEHIAAAGKVAAAVEGIHCVNNLLVVGTPSR